MLHGNNSLNKNASIGTNSAIRKNKLSYDIEIIKNR